MALADTWPLALPGNPQSAIVALLSLGAPLIDALLGGAPRHVLGGHLTDDTKAPAREHRPGRLHPDRRRATPVRHLGSAMLRGLAGAQGFAVLPPGGSGAGDSVDGWRCPTDAVRRDGSGHRWVRSRQTGPTDPLDQEGFSAPGRA